ncbi:caspase domain-containing protein [Streptomyces sp. NPDC058773]|uniref:caspase family protein n=1 Tax=Streptomyces sp. NPDC058773 TaxID=3346632 RepID=UPI0036B5A777
MARLPRFDASYALLIGVSEYQDHEFPEVPAAIHNLAGLRSLLAPSDGGGFPREKCRMVSNPRTGEGMRVAIKRAAESATDVLLLYYVGHGWKVDGDLYLASQSSSPDSIETTGLAYRTVRRLVRSSPAAVRIIVLDCCFSGVATGLLSGAGDLCLSASEIEIPLAEELPDDHADGVCVIASSGPNQPSQDSDGADHTAFTGHFLTNLKAATQMPEVRDVEAVFDATKAAMEAAELRHVPLIASMGGARRLALVKGLVVPAPVPVAEPEVTLVPPPEAGDETVTATAPVPREDGPAKLMSWHTPVGSADIFDSTLALTLLRQAMARGGDDERAG